MITSKKFTWSRFAEKQLVDVVDEFGNTKSWPQILAAFCKKCPDFNGTTNALQLRYNRLVNVSEPKEEISYKYSWSSISEKQLLSVVDAFGNDKPWSQIHKDFSKISPDFKGTANSLRLKYNKLVDDSEQPQDKLYPNLGNDNAIGSTRNCDKTSKYKQYSWTQHSEKLLLSLVNAYGMDKSWSHIHEAFCKTFPGFDGTSNALRMKYNRLVKETDQKQYAKTQDANYPEFIWNEKANLDLLRLVKSISVLDYPNWSKIYHTFMVMYSTFGGTKDDLREQYNRIQNKMQAFKHSESNADELWDQKKQYCLVEAYGTANAVKNAQITDGRKFKIENLAYTVIANFKTIYKRANGIDYTGSDNTILKHYIEHKKSAGVCSGFVSKNEDDSMSYFVLKTYYAYASKNHSLVFSDLFSGCCHNCGFLFFRKSSFSVRYINEPLLGKPMVEEMFDNVPYNYKKDDRYITCIECSRNPTWVNDYSIELSTSGLSEIPVALRCLNEYERNQVALCGGFYSVSTNKNPFTRVYEHRQGESNIGKKRDTDYQKAFIAVFGIEKPYQHPSSNEKIKTALLWLRRNNHLYRDFLSNYETLYGYAMSLSNLRPEERLIQISKGTLSECVGKDSKGLLIPYENVRIEGKVRPTEHVFGVQHPMQSHLDKIKEIIKVDYGDAYLEAKRWPHLFPEGTGSWKCGSALKPQTYVKKRILNVDSRFRSQSEFMFFWYDRLIKSRLLYFNRSRTVKVKQLINPLITNDIRVNESKFGSVVPTSIPGSRNYWNARCMDLLAIVRDLGKPDLFITLTQNDNWLEIQTACGHITRSQLDDLNEPVMQPAIRGESVVDFPVEVVTAFYRRLECFFRSCIHNKKGPFGEVIDHWHRIEYQNRGALHCHMLLWVCEDTVPDNVVMAQLPRYCGDDEAKKCATLMSREYVKGFQIHNCRPERCYISRQGKVTRTCKYGFPFDLQYEEEESESKMGFTYVRKLEEDKRVVPYNLEALLLWNGHINVQKVTTGGIETYLCKYISKPERCIQVKDVTSDVEKFLKTRVVGVLECCAHLLQLKQVQSTRKVLYLPCDFEPENKMLKRKSHLPLDEFSDDIYYKSNLEKYLERPSELENFTYPDLFRFYDVITFQTNIINDETADTDDTQDEFPVRLDETQSEFSFRITQVKSHRKKYNTPNFRYIERLKAAVPRWRFIMPFGNESEKYYEQYLLLNVPITKSELDENGFPFSEQNVSKTFVEECCMRDLIDTEKTAMSALLGAIQMGFSAQRVLEVAAMFVDKQYITKEYADSIVLPWMDNLPQIEVEDDENENYLEKMINAQLEVKPFCVYYENMTECQRNVMDWVVHKVDASDQILAIISGGAGVGKSYITKAIYSYFKERKMICVLLATTGSAAHIIGGTTIHYYLKIDIEGNSYLERGTLSSKIVEDTDVIIIDEFSMLTSDLLDNVDETTRRFSNSPNSLFGGKHVFLIGDPAQLPSIGTPVFANTMLNKFSILVLKECVRQKDKKFSELLNRLRINELTAGDKAILRERYQPLTDIDPVDDVLIVTATRKKMEYYNMKLLDALHGKAVAIIAEDYQADNNMRVSDAVANTIKKYVKNRWCDTLIVKEGCIVRLSRNIDVPSGWVNSKRAKVFRVSADGLYIILEDLEDSSKQLPLTRMRQTLKLGSSVYHRVQYPITLGYSSTIHAVQGTTVTGKYYVDLDRSFWESGQAFVALSRPKELSQLILLNTHFENVYIRKYYKDLLRWMEDVDETAVFKKPRGSGFPIWVPDDSSSKMQTDEESAYNSVPNEPRKPVDRPFKLPWTKLELRTSSSQVQQPVTSEDTEANSESCFFDRDVNSTKNVSSAEDPRLELLASNFLTNISRSKIDAQRFGSRFFDYLVRKINDELLIWSVSNPTDDRHTNCNTGRLHQIWDTKKTQLTSIFAELVIKYRQHFELAWEYLKSLEPCAYHRQTLHECIQIPLVLKEALKPVTVVGDGRCCYHAVSVNLVGSDILSNMLKMLGAFVVYIDADNFDARFFNFGSCAADVVLKTMSYNYWADNEVILTLSILLNRPIDVISSFCGIPGWRDQRYNGNISDRTPIRLAHVRSSDSKAAPDHFVALLVDPGQNLSLPAPAVEITCNISSQVNESNRVGVVLDYEDVDMESLTLDDYSSDDSL